MDITGDSYAHLSVLEMKTALRSYERGEGGKDGPTRSAIKAVMDARRGSSSYGRQRARIEGTTHLNRPNPLWCREKGHLNHHSAKIWILRDPSEVIHRVRNLDAWASQNTHLFHDDRPASALSFSQRIATGIHQLNSARATLKSYRGWTLIEVLDSE